MDAVARQLEVAEGFALLNMHLEAWEALEAIPAKHRSRADVLSVKLTVAQGMERWQLGSELVKLISPHSPLEQREAAGRFHLAHAIILCTMGDITAARAAVLELAIVWPEGRDLVMDSAVLAAVW